MAFVYAIIRETEWGLEIREDIKGNDSLAKFTDARILALYKGNQKMRTKHIYKVYPDSSCEVML